MNLRLLVLLVSGFIFTNFVSAQINLTNNKVNLVANGGDVYGNGRLLSKSDIMLILKDSPDQIEFYTSGKRLRGTGAYFIVGGVFATIGGFTLMAINTETTEDAYGNSVSTNGSGSGAGFLLGVAGQVLIANGFVCQIMGKNKIKRAVSDFNLSAYQSQPAKYNLTLGLNSKGLVLALNF